MLNGIRSYFTVCIAWRASHDSVGTRTAQMRLEIARLSCDTVEKFHSSYHVTTHKQHDTTRELHGRTETLQVPLAHDHIRSSRSRTSSSETSATRAAVPSFRSACRATHSERRGRLISVRPRYRKLRRGSTTASHRRSSSCAWRLHLEQPGQPRASHPLGYQRRAQSAPHYNSRVTWINEVLIHGSAEISTRKP